jgi:glyoxylase-like metal-dependent hydrolase (beta-lactamase superfamily II)
MAVAGKSTAQAADLDDVAVAAATPFSADLTVIRALAAMVPGPRPCAINGVKVAASVRPRRVVVEGGDETPVVMPRTAFQIVYPHGTIMLDAGLDEETHASFGKGEDEPYYPDSFARLRQALAHADAIVLTHYHADHVAGVVRSPDFAALARKTMVTRQTLRLMVEAPHRPELRVDRDAAALFVTMDYDRYLPIAPGVVLIKSPGHSPDSQMVYIALQSGREFLHSVDTAWTMDNIIQLKGKAAPWVKEDAAAVLGQLAWLKALHTAEPELTILITHDDTVFNAVTRNGIVGETLLG